jgi:cell division protein FtsZ
MDDFDAASRVIHEQISPDDNVLIGLISEEQLGYNVKVTVLTVSES